MTMDSNDMIGAIKAAEAEAAEMVQKAEEARRQAIAQAEQDATRRLAEERQRLQQEYAAAVSRSREQADKELGDAGREAETLARKLAQVPAERFERAVAVAVQALRKQWQ